MATQTKNARQPRYLKALNESVTALNTEVAALSVTAGAKNPKNAVRVATTANGTLATAYANGETVDGVTLATGDRILLKDQTAADENGLYTVNATGAPTRATDADTLAEVEEGLYTVVTQGTANTATAWLLTTAPAVIDTNDWVFELYADAVTAGTAVQPEDNSSNYGMMTHAGATMTVAGAGTAVAVIGTTVAKGDANGWTVGTDGTHTATFTGTKTVRVQGVLKLSPIATNVDNLTLHVYVNGASVFESAANDINDTTPELFEVDFMTNVANGQVVQLYVENADSTADIIVAAYTDRIDTAPSSGWFSVMAV